MLLEGVNIVTMTSSVRECSVIYHITQHKQVPAYQHIQFQLGHENQTSVVEEK